MGWVQEHCNSILIVGLIYSKTLKCWHVKTMIYNVFAPSQQIVFAIDVYSTLRNATVKILNISNRKNTSYFYKVRILRM